MIKFSKVTAGMAVMLVASTAAFSEGGPVGIAFVLAPEQSSGVCFADNLDRAMECARAQCVAGYEGVRASDCLRVQWCYPAGWSADIFFQNEDGYHGHDYLCGWSSRELLVEAASLKCDRDRNPHIADCSIVRIWDGEGKEVETE